MEYIQFIVTIIIILVIFYIANYAKRKQDKELKKMQDDLKEGDFEDLSKRDRNINRKMGCSRFR